MRVARQAKKLLLRNRWPLSLVGITTAFMLIAVPLATLVIPNGRVLTEPILSVWAIWDAPHYLYMAQHGYQTVGDGAFFIVFFPVWPLLIWLVHWLTFLDYTLASYVAAFICSCLSACLLYELVTLDWDKATARRAVLFLLLFPTSIFLHLPYPESIFLALVLGVFVCLRHEKFLWALILAAILTATRMQGVVIVPVILVELFMYHRQALRHRPVLGLQALVIPSLGILTYLAINYRLFGSPLYFLSVQRDHWYSLPGAPWDGLRMTIERNSSWQGWNLILLVYAQLAAAAVGLGASLYALVRLRLSYGLYALGIFIISTSTGTWVSVPRYILVIFPIYIILARLTKNRLAARFAYVITGSLWVVAVFLGVEHLSLF